MDKKQEQQRTPWDVIKFNQYLTDHDGNKEKLKELFTSDKALLQAPTGSGKTYSIIPLAEQHAAETGEKIIFTVPKKAQAEQIEKEYNIPAVTGDTKQILSNSNVVCCVYDSIDKVFSLNNWPRTKNIIILVDEAHRLTYDSTFRSRAVKRIKSNLQHTKTIFITATPQAIKQDEFNIRLKAIPAQANNNYKVCQIYNYEKSLIESILPIINHTARPNPATGAKLKQLIFIDDKNQLKALKKVLELYNYKVALLTSETKDGDAMQGLIKESQLKEYDIFLSTSVIEEGINIKNKELFNCIYAMNSTAPNYDSLEQAAARLRTKGHSIVIMRKKQDEKIILSENNFTINESEYTELTEKAEIINARYKEFKALGLIESEKGFIDSLTIGKYLIYNDEVDRWEIDADRLRRKQQLDLFKSIYSNDDTHKAEIKRRVKADKFQSINFKEGADAQQLEQYKEIKKELKEEQDDDTKTLLEIIKDFSPAGVFTLEEALFTNSIGIKGVPINEVEKGYIKLIREDKKASAIIKACTTYKLDIKAVLQDHGTEYKILKHYIRRERYKRYNKMVFSEMITILDLNDKEASEYLKIRKLLDPMQGKELNKQQLLKVYKIKNPHTATTCRSITEKQLLKTNDIINEIYKTYTKKDGRIKIGKLL